MPSCCTKACMGIRLPFLVLSDKLIQTMLFEGCSLKDALYHLHNNNINKKIEMKIYKSLSERNNVECVYTMPDLYCNWSIMYLVYNVPGI